MRRSLWIAWVVACGCGSPAGNDVDTATDTDEPASSGSSDAATTDTAAADGDTDDADATASATTNGDVDGDDDDDGSTGGCEGAECGGGTPTLLWTTIADDNYGDGFCQSVTGDGEGGMFASYLGYGWETYSDVFAVDGSGQVTGRGSGAEAVSYVDLATRGPGLFDWAAASGQVGIADAGLTNLDGGMLAFDVDQIRAMVRGPDALQYVVRTTPTFQCVVRSGTDSMADSLPFPCAPNFSEEALLLDDLGNRYYVEPHAYRVRRVDPAGLAYGSVDGRWNRVGLDAAVDPDGNLWVVGAIGSDPSDVYGGFVARHAFDLAAPPPFEDAVEGPVVWTSVSMTSHGPIVFGHEGYGEYMHVRGLDFDGTTRWRWSQEVMPQIYVNETAIDTDGNLLACGYRFSGELTPVGSDIHHPLFMKFEL